MNLQRHERLHALRELFASRHRFCGTLVERGYAAFGPAWAEDFEGVLRSLFPDDESLAQAAQAYATFAFDSMRRQKAFEAAGEYPQKTHAQAAQEVYFNEERMANEYLPGLLLSHFLWPHAYRQLQFFQAAFVEPLSRSNQPGFAEVGVGTGVYSRRILEQVPAATGTGYDISPSSCRYAEDNIRAAGVADRYEVRCQDVPAQPVDPVPWLVCVEVLEHLEEPVAFLRALRAALLPGGKAFITAAINAAHADHIYLYRSGAEVEADLAEAGFAIEQALTASAFPSPGAGVPVPAAAAFVGVPA